jgi:beta-galactosidase
MCIRDRRYEAVRLELNGRLIGEKPTTRAEEFKAAFDVPYAPGELKAFGLRDGRAVESCILRSAGEATKLRLSVDRSRLRADGQDLAFVTIEALDQQGVWQPWATPRVRVEVAGAGTLAALGSGDLASLDSYAGPERTLYQGRALAVVRAGKRAGHIVVTISAPGFDPVKVKLKTINP